MQPQQPYEIGMVGLGVMGRSFLLDIPSTTGATAIYRF
jgi:6-phosphogluconate dehydrogenase